MCNVVVIFVQVTGWKSFIHLRHFVTPPPAEDMKWNDIFPYYDTISATRTTKESGRWSYKQQRFCMSRKSWPQDG